MRNTTPIPFVIDISLHHLYCDPKSIPSRCRKEIAIEVMRRLSPSPYTVKKMWDELHRVKNRSRKLIPWITESQKREISSWWYPFAKKHKIPTNALFFMHDFRRTHPMGRVLGQVLHAVQERRDEITGQAVPVGGLELSLNEYLDGKNGKKRLMRSPRNTLETGEVLSSPIDGAHVELTVNHYIQAIVEEELERGIIQAEAKSGWAVVIDPKTGYILALAQYPFFFPDHYMDYFNDKEKIARTKCCAISDAYEPGSPAKVFTIAAALQANKELERQKKAPLFSPLEKIPTRSGLFPGRSKPITDVQPYNFLNMYMAVQKSSNIYMANLASRIVRQMGDTWYRSMLTSFGFEKKTGIELLGESFGHFPKPGKIVGKGKLEWSKATPYSLAMGYNFQATTCQMARAFCVFANGGVLPELTLVKKIFCIIPDPDTGEPIREEVVLDHTDVEQRFSSFPRILDQDIVEKTIHALKFVMKPGGSASKADIYGYTEAGKTGTTMKLFQGGYTNKKHFSSFIGFAPLSSPKFVLAIGIDEPKVGFIPNKGMNHRGGTCATPIFKEIGRRLLKSMNIPEDDPYGYPKGDPRSNLGKSDWFKETESLRKLLENWNPKP